MTRLLSLIRDERHRMAFMVGGIAGTLAAIIGAGVRI
jgi:hypothetical protein